MTQRELPIFGPNPPARETRAEIVRVTSGSRDERSSVRAVVVLLSLFGLGLGALVLYTHSFMSMPAEIGLEHRIDPPHPRSHELQPPLAAGATACAHGSSAR